MILPSKFPMVHRFPNEKTSPAARITSVRASFTRPQRQPLVARSEEMRLEEAKASTSVPAVQSWHRRGNKWVN
jgi:hypothetical protein